MHDDEIFNQATRVEDWAHLAGTASQARAKSTALRRTRYAGIVGATTAAAVGVAVVVGTFGTGAGAGAAGSTAAVQPGNAPAAHTTSPAGHPAPATSSSSSARALVKAPVPGTMGAIFQQWKSCPDSELTVVNSLPQDPSNLQRRWRDACHRDVATLSALLPGYEVTPAVADIGTPAGGEPPNPSSFDDPAYVVPAGYVPHMGPSLYRVVGEDGTTTRIVIRAYGHDDQTEPVTGQDITLPNGLKARLTLGTAVTKGTPGYEIYILSGGKTFYLIAWGKPDFDFKALVTSSQFAEMAARALAEPES